jgi:hypothetical protein
MHYAGFSFSNVVFSLNFVIASGRAENFDFAGRIFIFRLQPELKN